jgi:hypothetical protein
MLWECKIKYKGSKNYKTEIRFSEGALNLDTKNIVSSVCKPFKYKYEDKVLPPSLFTSSVDGKRYIVPTWQEVDPRTMLVDIEWVKPAMKKVDIIVAKDSKYDTKYDPNKKRFTCNCQGFWRVKDKSLGCKHIQALRLELGIK